MLFTLILAFNLLNKKQSNREISIGDQSIIEKMRSKKSKAEGLRLMMDAYQSRLYWHIRRLVVYHEDAEDLLQDTFVKAYKNFDKFKEKSKIYTWLYRIATNEALQFLNKKKKLLKSDEGMEYFLQTAVAENAKHNAEEIEILLQKAIQTLPEKQKLVFTIRYFDELPYEEIAEIVEMSVGTLKTNYHYAKEKITQYLREHSEDPENE